MNLQQQHEAEERRYKSKIILTTTEKKENDLHINCEKNAALKNVILVKCDFFSIFHTIAKKFKNTGKIQYLMQY